MGGWTAHLLLALLAPSAGMFVAASGLLPSSFAMCSLTAGAAAVLAGQPLRVVAAGAAGLVWGWPVSGTKSYERARDVSLCEGESDAKSLRKTPHN